MNKILLIVGVLFIGIIGLGLFVDSNKPEPQTYSAEEALEIIESDYVSGDRDASVVFMEFSDLQCPACKQYYPLINELKEQYADQDVAFVIKDFPLPFHIQAREAAFALRAAKAQGQYDEMRTLIFDNQIVWSGNDQAKNLFEGYAEDLGLDIDQFNTDRESEEIQMRVTNDVAKGRALDVNSTPTFLLNGEKISAQSVEQFSALIDAALNQDETDETNETTVNIDVSAN